jgi:hypothetical protein
MRGRFWVNSMSMRTVRTAVGSVSRKDAKPRRRGKSAPQHFTGFVRGGSGARLTLLSNGVRVTGGHHATHRSSYRPPLLSRSALNAAKAIHPKRASNAGYASCAAAKWNSWRSWAAMIPAPVVRGRGFKACCLTGGRFRRGGAA